MIVKECIELMWLGDFLLFAMMERAYQRYLYSS